jgi:hypothetical protein
MAVVGIDSNPNAKIGNRSLIIIMKRYLGSHSHLKYAIDARIADVSGTHHDWPRICLIKTNFMLFFCRIKTNKRDSLEAIIIVINHDIISEKTFR